MLRSLIAVAALALVLLTPLAVGQDFSAEISAASPAPESAERFGDVPEFSFVERSGRTITREDLIGSPWLAVPFFVRCSGP